VPGYRDQRKGRLVRDAILILPVFLAIRQAGNVETRGRSSLVFAQAFEGIGPLAMEQPLQRRVWSIIRVARVSALARVHAGHAFLHLYSSSFIVEINISARGSGGGLDGERTGVLLDGIIECRLPFRPKNIKSAEIAVASPSPPPPFLSPISHLIAATGILVETLGAAGF
jgi:hypothetical protein